MEHKEEEAIVLDFLPNGYPFDNKPAHLKTPIGQAIGRKHFVLLELVPKKGVFLQPYEDVYIGENKREKIHHVNGKLDFEKLTSTARNELSYVIKDLVDKDQKRFIDFFNTARPLTTRMHQLELLPGLGKKHMWEILEKREEPFKSFEDIKKRVKLMPDPEKSIIKRIISEIEGNEKYRLFTE
jgi:putative nucleotide binding protein